MRVYQSLLLCLLLFSCTSDQPSVGGVETTNALIKSKVIYPNGEVASGSVIKVYPKDYIQGETIKTYVADESGNFTISTLEHGEYSIEINDAKTHASLFSLLFFSNTTDTTLEDKVILPYAELSGTIESLSTENVRVQISGLDRTSELDVSGSFIFDNLPEGEYTLEVVSETQELITIPNIQATSEQTLDIIVSDSGIMYEKKILINAPQAGIEEDLYNFPLLVRLNSTNFDFASAEKNIHITKTNGTALPYEIEQWDELREIGVIWVGVDTVHSVQPTVLSIKWGEGISTKESQVFSSSNSFGGVWHLDDSANISNAVDTTMLSENFEVGTIDGIIGSSFNFTNMKFILLSPEAFADVDQEVTISLWQYGVDVDEEDPTVTMFDGRTTDTTLNHLLTVHLPWYHSLAVGPAIYWDAGDSAQNNSRLYESVEPEDYKAQWNQWTFTKNSVTAEMFIFKNGEVFQQGVRENSSMSGIGIFKIGDLSSDYNGKNYNGYLDEFRVSHVVRSDDWIKLSYENQKIGSSLVTIGGK